MADSHGTLLIRLTDLPQYDIPLMFCAGREGVVIMWDTPTLVDFFFNNTGGLHFRIIPSDGNTLVNIYAVPDSALNRCFVFMDVFDILGAE